MNYDNFLETLGVDKEELACLFWRTFRSGTVLGNFQMSLASQFYQGRYWFKINSTGTAVPLDGLVQGGRRTMKPSCMHLFNTQALLTYGQLLSRVGHLLPFNQTCFCGERGYLVDEAEKNKDRNFPLW